VQLVFDLPGGSSLHVTSYLWYTPTHRELDGKGLPPTITVEPAADGSDAELARAIEVLQNREP
jgi:C-terminal processing protease CtpA/Prc